jgi:uncharacterized sulfatase
MIRIFVLPVALLSCSSFARAAEPPRYNLISIVTDDQGQWALGCYGNKECRTPHMDRLAREGARFTHAFTATPVCSPSRASFLTGRYGTEVGITDYIAPNESEAGVGLPAKFPTWPAALQKHGYQTGLIGKWHLGGKPEFHPTKHGFHHFAGFLGGGTTPMNPTYEKDGKTQPIAGSEPEVAVNEAITFIEKNQARPFALCLHFRAPHLPYGPVPKEDADVFKDLDPTIPDFPGLDVAKTKQWHRDYYASIHSVDRNLGRLLARLDELKLAKNTIVLFTSDHGYNIGQHGIHTKGNGFSITGGVNGPKRPNMWDTSIKVPLLVRWPGVVKPGTEVHEVVSNIDTYASVLSMLGVPLPKDVKQHGLDFSTLLRGGDGVWPRQALFGQYNLHNNGLAYMRMIRTAKWKLVRHHHANLLDELYDLKNDPGETRNLANNVKFADVREQLQKQLTEWQQAIDDPVLRGQQ